MSDTQRLPILPLRDIVVFPHMVVPLFVGRDKSIAALEDVMQAEKRIVLLSQKNSDTDEPTADDLFDRGCIAKILQLLKLPDGTVRVLVEGEDRVAVTNLTVGDFLEGDIRITKSEEADKDHVAAMAKEVRKGFESYGKLNKKVADEVISSVLETTDASKLSDIVSVHLGADIARKQSLLESTEVGDRLAQILELLDGEASVLKVEKKIRGRVKRQMEKTQREYYLNEQMKAIQTCLLYTSPSPRD